MSKRKRKRSFTLIFVLLTGIASAYFIYTNFLSERVALKDKNYAYVFIGREDDFEDVIDHIKGQDIIDKTETFEWLAKKMDLPNNIHPGRFRITNGMNMRQVINLLKYNKQENVKLTFNSQIKNLDDFVEYVDEKLELSGSEIEDFITDEKRLYDAFKLDPENCFAMLTPGAFEVSWAISTTEFIEVLKKRFYSVWNSERKARANKLGYTIPELVTIASIVQSESSIATEQQKIAGVYINRLRKNMPLQADPTLKFANKNFEVSRVLTVDKQINSPYNTYKYKGLPPGPICIVGQQAIDATLNYNKHSFLYFCANPKLNGFSDFSTTYEQHRKYANAYRKKLDKIGISR